MNEEYTLAELAKRVGGTVRGEAALRVRGVNSLSEAEPGQITWASNERYRAELHASRASAVVVSPRFGATPMPAILVDDPDLAFTRIIACFAPTVPRPAVGRHPTAVIAASARVDETAAIGANVIIGERVRIGRGSVLHGQVFIGDDVEIGEACELWPGVVVRERCVLRNRVIVHANASIGADGFGFHFAEGRHNRIPQIGGVLIEDDAEIGACSCVDRAKFGVTRIGAGTKIDNHVMVAHNVQIGEHCILVGQVGLCGSTKVGNYVVFGARSGTGDHVEIGDQAIVTGGAMVTKRIPPGRVVGGFPAIDHREHLREQAYLRRVPDLEAKLKDLARRVGQLESATDDQSAE